MAREFESEGEVDESGWLVTLGLALDESGRFTLNNWASRYDGAASLRAVGVWSESAGGFTIDVEQSTWPRFPPRTRHVFVCAADGSLTIDGFRLSAKDERRL